MTSSDKDNRPIGMRKGLTKYGDDEFALFLRKSFIKGAGYGDDARAGLLLALSIPIVILTPVMAMQKSLPSV